MRVCVCVCVRQMLTCFALWWCVWLVQYSDNAEAGPSRPMTPGGIITPGFKKGGVNSLLQSALGVSRPPSSAEGGGGHSRSSSTVSSSKQPYVPPPVISTAQQFHEHFAHLTSTLLHSQDSAYRAHLDEIQSYSDACALIAKELQSSSELVEGMIGCLKWVEERGENLRVAGETLMQEEVSHLPHLIDGWATDMTSLR